MVTGFVIGVMVGLMIWALVMEVRRVKVTMPKVMYLRRVEDTETDNG